MLGRPMPSPSFSTAASISIEQLTAAKLSVPQWSIADADTSDNRVRFSFTV
jgi:hypothetical protein